jgi:hypothetical protein
MTSLQKVSQRLAQQVSPLEMPLWFELLELLGAQTERQEVSVLAAVGSPFSRYAPYAL